MNRHLEWSSEAEHELRRIVRQQAEEVLRLERENRKLKAELREKNRKPIPMVAMRVGAR